MYRPLLFATSLSARASFNAAKSFTNLSQQTQHNQFVNLSNRPYSQQFCQSTGGRHFSLNTRFAPILNSHFQLTIHRYAHSAAPAEGGAQPFILTDVGEGIAEVEIINFYVKVGDRLSEFDRVCEVQSDKATVEITSRYEGVVSKVYYQKGDIAKVGKPLIDVTLSSHSASAAPAPATPTPTTPTPTTPTSPSNPAPSTSQGHTISSHEDQFTTSIRTSSGGTRKVLATPAVRRLASEKKLTLSTISGTGRDGRVTKADIIRALEQPTPVTKETHGAAVPETKVSQETLSITEEDREVPIRGYARAMVKTMTAAAKVPHFGYADELEVDNIIAFRKMLLRAANERGVEKLTLMPIFLKALSLSLKAFPIVNSQLKEESMSLVYKASHNIGVAMDTPSGLVVPNIKNCQNKSILEIAQDLNRLMGLAKENKLSVNELTGGTITLSNVGTIGGTYTSPILNIPEVAIGALGKIQTVPRFDSQGHVKPVQIIQLSWSADHRVLDGATVARFSTLFKRYVENPTSMLLECR
eukprot:TRINITY_DN1821_c0_g1_i1.p1 TRINITY_DN1821_c0_g1~~TRINITY_DN1821_c0_g1_i1.p1  ORF type:complete len:540 (-),score=126.95 TRINITY_DN1821_c0_g1_i1:108-1688(-)